ncbi:MAG: hypothetical protein ABIT05_08530 [Chitinophagaceae bacterium]
MVKTNFFKQLRAVLSVVLVAATLFFLASCNNSSKGKETKDSVTVEKTDSIKMNNGGDKMMEDSIDHSDSSKLKGEQTPPPK